MTDVDSICGAIAYAYTRTYTSTPLTFHIPLANISYSDVALRTELTPVFANADIDASEIITLSDLPALEERSMKLPASRTRWILVDHNALTGELAQDYTGSIVGCIDHHDEENKVPKDCGDEPRIIEKSGSCTSLIVEECRKRDQWDVIDPSSSIAFAWLALGPILIDTQALTSMHKVTDHDIASANALELVLGASHTEYDRQKYYDDIHNAKEDIGHLSLYDILRKDYKQWDESAIAGCKLDIGISSTVKPLPFLIAKAGGVANLMTEIDIFSAERGLSIISIMTSYTSSSGEYSRELFVMGRDAAGVGALRRFEERNVEALKLVKADFGLDNDDDEDCGVSRAWFQRATEASRKQVAPLLRLAAV